MGSISGFGTEQNFDVIVVGGGNAALCAALSAHDHGARVLVLESAPREHRGGNSRFAGTVFRASHVGMEAVKELLCAEAMADAAVCDMLPYTPQDYSNDLSKTSHGRNDKIISEIMVHQGWETLQWMKAKGVKWELIVRKYQNLDALREKHNTVSLEPGAPVMARGGGVGLTDSLWAAVESLVPDGRMTVWYDSPAHDLLVTGDTVHGVKVRSRDAFIDLYGKVILASGGYVQSHEMTKISCPYSDLILQIFIKSSNASPVPRRGLGSSPRTWN